LILVAVDWALCLPDRIREFEKRIMVLHFRDRIDGWWNLKFHPRDYSKASLGRQKQKATPKAKAL